MYCFDCFFFFKQKTAYEMRISDWSSDVCSSDLLVARRRAVDHDARAGIDGADIVGKAGARRAVEDDVDAAGHLADLLAPFGIGEQQEIGRASCRERVCQYV